MKMRAKIFLSAAIALSTLVAFAKGGKAFRANDEKMIAALDTEYQAAVEKNDAAAMDRILADDFVLVTGSGKTYSKADEAVAADRETAHRHLRSIVGEQRINQSVAIADLRNVARRGTAAEDNLVQHRTIRLLGSG